ncbi:MAG: ABC transporter permease [Cyclobacteriaceae bacterium]|nr:ABC transporter permease [Cyclobacteriaceae bacterium]
MSQIPSRLFINIILRNREVYLLKIITLAIALASSILIILFSINEFGYDTYHKDSKSVFRVLQRTTDEEYSGNRLSAKIPIDIIHQLADSKDSLTVSRVKIMKDITIISRDQAYDGQKIHAVDPSITRIFSFESIDGDIRKFSSPNEPTVILSSSAAMRFTGAVNASGKSMHFITSGDTVTAIIAAVFKDFPQNTHEDFNVFLAFDPTVIKSLSFDPDETGVYGRKSIINPSPIKKGKLEYSFQTITEIYFGPRVLGEDARHGDSYSVIILGCIAGLILFLAITSFVNLTTLTLPYRSKELAIKKLSGTSQSKLFYDFFKESFTLVGIALIIALMMLLGAHSYIESILGLRTIDMFLHGDIVLLMTILSLFIALTLSPLFLVVRFIRASPNRLLRTDTITFPTFKRTITFLQLGISIFLIIASVVVRRQINYSLIKEPGRNQDQVIYIDSPSGMTNEHISILRSDWKKDNPNIVDVIGVSQLPDRINSQEIGTGLYLLKADAGFRDFFHFTMDEGNWFNVNDDKSMVIVNKNGKVMFKRDTSLIRGVIQDLSGQFNQPEKPIIIKLGSDYNYNWLCVRVLEVDIRRTVSELSRQFSSREGKSNVHFLDSRFENWLNYQDRLNVLSEILTMISLLLSCCAIYGLSVSLVRDKMKQIAIHKLYGAPIQQITQLLVKAFAKEMLIALIVFGPLTYIFLSELLRTFVYATKFNWLDPVYPIAYCAFIISALCVFQALSLNRSNLTSSLKG